MFLIRGIHDIYISRGEAVSIGVNLEAKDECGQTDYEMADTEFVVFKLWDKVYNREIKNIKSELGSSIIDIPAEFTSNLIGEYKYSVDLFYADGSRETIIGQSPNTAPKFNIMEA